MRYPSTIPAGTSVKTHLLHADRPGSPADLKLFTERPASMPTSSAWS